MALPTNPVAPTTASVRPWVELAMFFLISEFADGRPPLTGDTFRRGKVRRLPRCFSAFIRLGAGAIYFANLSVCFLALHPAASQAQSSWVISAIHPDPTPFLGAPESEYIALFSRDSVSGCRSHAGA